ncbi:MAG TPA: hypothetical protein VL118_10220 [Luteimonas sp.]|jgi:hypothetical protein|nr:hypothetical protein [Luteimonas sp.]
MAAADRAARPGVLLPLLAVVAAALAFNAWVLDPAHFFFADDWGWLDRAHFRPWQETIHLFPTALYNDRPVGELLIRAMYRMFWLRHGAWNQAWLALHALNAGLLVLLARPWLPPFRAALAGVLAACWFSTLTAVHWIGAVFDLVGATLVLGTLLAYQHAVLSQGRRWPWLALSVVLHLAAIRTKEFALGMVAVLAIWEFVLLRRDGWRERCLRLSPHVLLAAVFVVLYAMLYREQHTALENGAYGLSLTATSVLEGIGWYFAQAFYAFVPGSNETHVGIGFAFAAAVVVVACCSRAGIASLASAAVLMAAVLLLGHQRHPLYLYVPHFLIAIALCAPFPRRRVADVVLALLVALLLYWPVHTGFLRDARNFVLIKGGYSKTLFYDYAALAQQGKPVSPVTIAVSETYFDPFSWGSGDAVRLYHDDDAMEVSVVALQAGVDPCADAAGSCFVERKGHLARVK